MQFTFNVLAKNPAQRDLSIKNTVEKWYPSSDYTYSLESIELVGEEEGTKNLVFAVIVEICPKNGLKNWLVKIRRW